MNSLFITFLSLSVSGGLLTVILLICKLLYKNRLSQRWQYYIWLIVIARLLIPYSFETSIVGNWFTNINTYIIEPISNAYYGNENNISLETGTENEVFTTEEAITSIKTLPTQKEVVENSSIWIIWIVVSLILFVRKITIYQSFVKYVRAGCEKVTDIEKLEYFGKIIAEHKIRSGVELCTNSLLSSPILIGFLKPCIVLPNANVSTSDFEFTLLHELTHYKHKDMFYKWLTQVAVCLHWFNPFVYLTCREINRACELSCDETVISKLDTRGKRQYGDTLLNAIKAGGNYKSSVTTVTLCESKKLLSERLGAIMNYKKQSKIMICLSMALVILLLCGVAYAGAYPIQKSTNKVKAPDDLPTITAKADTITQTEYPNVDITIEDNTAVKFVTTTNKEITVDYSSRLYNVSVLNEKGNWKIHIAYKGVYSKYPAATLYIPSSTYGNVNIQAKQATVYFNSVFQQSNNINADMELSSIFYTIPKGFTGELKASMPNSYLELRSDNEFKNCNITISNCDSYGNIAEGFKKQGNLLKYTNGTQTGVLNIDFKSGGYAIIE